MAAKKYSAGAIFLQVVPVFGNVQRAIEDEAKNIDRALGDQMEKSGEKAGERAGKAASKRMNTELEKGSKEIDSIFAKEFKKSITEIDEALNGIDVKRLPNEARKEIGALKREIRELAKTDLFDDKALARSEATLHSMAGDIQRMRDNAKITLKDNFGAAEKGLRRIVNQIDRFKEPIELDIRPERKQGTFEKSIKTMMEKAGRHLEGNMTRKAVELREELESLGNLRVGVDIGANQLFNEVRQIQAQLRRLEEDSVEIDAKADFGSAYAELAALGRMAEALDGKNVEIEARVNDINARRGLFGIQRSSDDAANSFRSFNGVLLAAAGLGPALIPVLGGIAGGLIAVGTAGGVAAFGVASAVIGFSGLGDAIDALGAKQDAQAANATAAAKANVSASYAIKDATQGVADAERSAAQSAADAAERVADARESAADAIEDALERQKDAQEAYRDSIDDVRDAERALREARKEAASTGEDLDFEIRTNDLALDQALLDSFSATTTYDATMADGSSTNAEQEQARIDRDEALLRLEELRAEQADLAKQKKKWDKEGVNGTEEVQSAQDALTSAIDAQRDAYDRVRDAAEAVDEARVDGAKAVADAIESQNRTLAANARSIERAREQLERARLASDDVAASITSQQHALDNAMDALGPAGQRFALFIFGLRAGWQDFRNDIQAAMLPSVEAGISGFIDSENASAAREAMVGMAAAFGRFVEALSISFQGPAWAAFFEMLAEYGPEISDAYGGGFIAFMEALASMMATLAPFALQFAEGFENLMQSLAGWAASEEGAEGLLRFVDYIKEIGPSVLEFFGLFVLALTNLMVALAPYGQMILDLIIGFLDWIATMDPATLGAFVGALLALITASQIAYAVMNLLMAGTALLTSVVGLAVFAFVAIGIAIYYVYQQNEALGIALGILVGTFFAVMAVSRAYMAVMGLLALAKFGYATATTGATASVVGLTFAQRIAMAVGRGFAAVQAALAFVTNGAALAMVRQKIATAALWIALKAYTLGARLAAVSTFLLNAAMLANPFGLIVLAVLALVGAIYVLWENHEGFRDFVLDAWEKIKDAFWSGLEIAKSALSGIGAGFSWLWEKAIKPAIGFIGSAFKSTFGFIKAAWTKVLWPVFKAIGKTLWTIWKTQVKIVLTLLLVAFKATFVAIKWVWDKVLRPVFNAIGAVLGWLWEKAVEPILGWIGEKWDDLMTGMKKVWDLVLKPMFSTIGDKVLPKLKGAFETTIAAIKAIWEGLKDVVAKPIKFVIEKIINEGLIKGFNKVAGWVGMDGFDPVPIPDSLQSYATGGIMPGYTPGRDVHQFASPTGGRLELSGGEAIMRPEWTAAVGPDFVNQMNAMARTGGVNAVRQAMGQGSYYLGGILPVMGARTSRHTSGYPGFAADLNVGSGSDDYGMAVRAWKDGIIAAMNFNGSGPNNPDGSYGRWMDINHGGSFSRYAHLASFAGGLTTGKEIGAGQVLGYVGSIGNSSAPHLHFEVNGGGVPIGAANLLSGEIGKTDDARSLPGYVLDVLKNPISTIKGWATSQFGKASDFINESPAFDVVKNAPSELVGGFKDEVFSIVPGWAKSAAGVAGKAAGKVGDGLGAVVDGVGAAGDALGFADGGVLPYNGTMMYDSGGYLQPGMTTVMNLTGKPEPVFTNDQWSKFENGAAGGSIHYEPHFEGSDLSPEDVAADLNFTFRRLRRRGKYEGIGS